MKREFIASLLIGLTFSLVFSQDFRISGFVMDAEGNPIVLANVLLLEVEGDFIKGTVTGDNGFFEFPKLVAGTYRVAASYIENTVESPLIQVNGDTKIEDLILNNAQMLDEVTVTRVMPRLEQLADRLVFNIANTALSDNDIWNVLKRTPGVMVMNNRLFINGSPNVSVMINGKRINLLEEDLINLLSGSSAGNVESVEVITSPPAKYSAEGGMMIDIKMKKNLVSGYNGSVFNRYTQGVLPKHTLGMDHFFKGKKLGFSTNYSFSDNRDWIRYTEITDFFENGAANETWSAEQKSIDRNKSHNLNLFLDVQLNERNTISLSSNNNFSPNRGMDFTSETDITDVNDNQTARLESVNNSNIDFFNTAYYLDWMHQLNDNGAEVSANTHFNYYDSQRHQILNNAIVDGDSEFISENTFNVSSHQIINLFSLQTDVTLPLNQHSIFETGLRYAAINSEATILQSGFDQIRPDVEATEFGTFNYDEQIYAGYISLNNNWENWNFNIGLRTEYTDTLGKLAANPERTTNSYLNWFPSFSVSYSVNKNSFFLKSYRRIIRPKYNIINPFQFYQTVNSIEEGNPNLKPAYRDYVQLDYIFDKTYKLVLFAGKQTDEQSQQVFQDNQTNILRVQYINLETNYYYGADASFSKDITPSWNAYFLISHFYDEDSFRDLNSNRVIKNSIWTTHTRATNSFTFLEDKSLFADLTYTHFSPRIRGNSRIQAFGKLGLALRKTLWNRTASISLAVEDIFNDGNIFATRDYLDQSNSTSTRRENRLFVFSFRYKFGNTQMKDNQKSKNTDEDKRL
jgi:hypothetical protein